MNYSESKEQAYEYFRRSLSGMMECRVPVNPVNYAVWYEHVSGKNTELSTAIEKLRRPFNSETHRELYQRYVAGDEKQVPLEVLKTITALLASLDRSAGREMTEHEEAITGYTSRLMEAGRPNEIGEIVDGILSRAKMITESGRTLKERVNESCRELEELREELSRFKVASLTDSLTGLLNRRGFEESFQKEIMDAGGGARPVSMIMIDIDHFKRVNDRLGHLMGDTVIRVVAGILGKYANGRGIAGRYGGEEFVICLPGTGLEDAEKFAEKIRKTVQSVIWRRKDTGASLGEITISLGVGEYRQGESLGDALERADSALYYSKENGRNRVSTEKEMSRHSKEINKDLKRAARQQEIKNNEKTQLQAPRRTLPTPFPRHP